MRMKVAHGHCEHLIGLTSVIVDCSMWQWLCLLCYYAFRFIIIYITVVYVLTLDRLYMYDVVHEYVYYSNTHCT